MASWERYIIVNQLSQPMQIFTHEEMTPGERVLRTIRQIAYTYRVVNQHAFCLN